MKIGADFSMPNSRERIVQYEYKEFLQIEQTSQIHNASQRGTLLFINNKGTFKNNHYHVKNKKQKNQQQ